MEMEENIIENKYCNYSKKDGKTNARKNNNYFTIEKENINYCPKCESLVNKKDIYCKNCGQILENVKSKREKFINQQEERSNLNNMYIYGWINPYRVRSSGRDISEASPAYKYLGTDYLYEDVGVYYNPSKREVEDLIVDGVLEVVSNYQVDGILFDDYFYPSYDLDYNDYINYLKDHDNISFDEYHLMIINRMISRVHEVCFKHDVMFGVSPDGNIENNYGMISADVKTWLSSRVYVDFIMPQVYYGFFNETKAFLHVIEEWNSLIKNDDIKLNIALAFYKVGVFDKYARSGSNEWINNSNIIMREIILSRNLKYYNGFSLFRYDFLFDDSLYTNTTMLEIENMRKILN